jgi:hypothetical protein
LEPQASRFRINLIHNCREKVFCPEARRISYLPQAQSFNCGLRVVIACDAGAF